MGVPGGRLDRREQNKVTVFIRCLAPYLLVTVVLLCSLHKDNSFYQATLSMQLSSQDLALSCPFRFRGGNGFNYLRGVKYLLFISINAAHIFVNSPFLKLFSDYPIFIGHLFLTYPNGIIGHQGPGVQSR